MPTKTTTSTRPVSRRTGGGSARHSEGMTQVRALSHPLRMRLIEIFAREPRTTKQAADILGEAPTRLYHHVAALEKAGLLELRETRAKRGTTEKYYATVSHKLVVGPEAAGLGRPEAARDHAALGLVLFEQARLELVQALSRSGHDAPEAMVAMRGVLHLTPRAARDLHKKLMAVVADARQASKNRKPTRTPKQRFVLTLALVPTPES